MIPRSRIRGILALCLNFALDTVLPMSLGAAKKAAVEAAMAGHVLGMAELVGTYKK